MREVMINGMFNIANRFTHQVCKLLHMMMVNFTARAK
jgi:hypothetical protein